MVNHTTLAPLAACNSSNTEEETGAAVPSFWIGVLAAIVGSMILAIGMNVQRLAHLKLQRRGLSSNFIFDRTWQLGLIIFIFGNFGDAVALAFAPQSVVTPLGCFSLVANIISARLILGEQIGLQTGIGSGIIICGVLLIVYPSSNGVGQCDDEDLDTLIRRWDRPEFRAFAIAHGIGLVCVLMFVRRLERMMFNAAATTSIEYSSTNLNVEDSMQSQSVRSSHIGPHLLPPNERAMLRLGYPLLIGLVASWTVLLVKMAGTLVRTTFEDGVGIWGRYESWVMVIGLFVSLPTQLTYLNRALARFEALFVVPALQCFWSLSSITMGALFFQEFDLYETWMYALFMTGVVVSLLGLVVISTASIETPKWLKSTRSFRTARKAKEVDPARKEVDLPDDMTETSVVVDEPYEPTPTRVRVEPAEENLTT